MIRTAILTISSTRRKDKDLSGKVIQNLLTDNEYETLNYEVIKDDNEAIKERLIHFADKIKADLILTTGGTGFGPMDVTPEATMGIIEKEAPGISELIRSEGLKKTEKAALSRGVSGIRGETLIINLPGSTKGAEESLKAVINIIPHAIDMIKGGSH